MYRITNITKYESINVVTSTGEAKSIGPGGTVDTPFLTKRINSQVAKGQVTAQYITDTTNLPENHSVDLLDAAARLTALETAGFGGGVSNIVYTNGVITQYTDLTGTYTVTYDGFGRPSTISNGTVTRTVAYNGDGTVSSIS